MKIKSENEKKKSLKYQEVVLRDNVEAWEKSAHSPPIEKRIVLAL